MNSEKQSTNLQMTLREVNRVGEGQKNVPKLRFKGYEDAWEQRKFMECINNIVDYRGKTPKKLEMNWSPEGYLALSALNVKDGYIDFELDANYGDIELYNAWMKQDLSKGQVVFTTEAPMGNVAQIPDDSKYILSQRVIAFEVAHEKITDDFLATLLKSPKVFDDLTSLATGGTAKGVSQKSLSKLSVKIPQIIEEQNKIAKIICTLNKAITLHQRKYDALKLMKKKLLSRMFPKNGEDVPEIRFKGFTDAWEQRKLGDIADIVGGGTPSTAVSKYWDGDIDWYAPAEIVDQIFVNSSQKKITTEGLNNSSAKILPVGTVLFTSRAGIGKTAILTKEGCTNQGFQSIIPHKDELDSYFIFSRTDELKRYGETVGAGSTFVEVSGKQMANMTISIPTTMGEQRQIGTYFRNLDNLITLHQRKLDELKNMKKTLLQQMFV